MPIRAARPSSRKGIIPLTFVDIVHNKDIRLALCARAAYLLVREYEKS